MAWAAIPAFLRARFNANEILVSLMLVYVATLLLSLLVHGPWRDPAGFNFPQTTLLPAAAMFEPFDYAVPAQPVDLHRARSRSSRCGCSADRSFPGFQMPVGGAAPPAARYAGFRQSAAVWIGLLVGRRCGRPRRHGRSRRPARPALAADLAGLRLRRDHRRLRRPAASVRHRARRAADVAALPRRRAAQMTLGLPSALTGVFQGMLLFFLLAADFFIFYRLRRLEGARLMDLFIAIFAGTSSPRRR